MIHFGNFLVLAIKPDGSQSPFSLILADFSQRLALFLLASAPTSPRNLQNNTCLRVSLWMSLVFCKLLNLTKVRLVKAMVFSSSCVRVWESDHREGWALKNCFQIIVLEIILESPLDCKEIKPVNPKGNESWIVIGRTDSEAETPILWPCDVKNQLIGKDPDAEKDWKQKEKEQQRMRSVVPFSPHLQYFSGAFPLSQFFASGGQSIGISTSVSVLPMNI